MNPDPWVRLVGERNESEIVVEGIKTTALIDSGAQLSQITLKFAKALGLPIQSLKERFTLEAAGGNTVEYYGYVAAQVQIPEVENFDEPCLLLVTKDTRYGEECPIIVGTLHIDLILSCATNEELNALSRSWKRGGLGSMVINKMAQKSGELDKIEGEIKLLKQIILAPGETKQVDGYSNHPLNSKRVNVIVEPLETPEGKYIVRVYTWTRGNSRRVQILLRNVSSGKVTLKKGARVARLSPANKIPPMLAPKREVIEIDPNTEKCPPECVKVKTVLNCTLEGPKHPLLDETCELTREQRIDKLFSKLDLTGCDEWTEKQKADAKNLITEYHHLFALEDKELGKTSLIKHKIRLDNPVPFKERHRRIPPHQYEEVRKHLQEMLEMGAIRRSHSPWASPVVLVRKKTGELRFCIDLRKLNNRTIKDAHALPRIEDSLDSLNGAQIFTSLDLKSGYWQVELDEESIPLTAFTVGPLGFYECCRMPFGLCNAPATFQRLMESCLGDLHLQWCIIYLDDIIVFSKTPEEHIERLRGVFEKLSSAGLKLKPSKCEFFKAEINYLGHVVSKEGIRTDDKKIQEILKWPIPTTVTEVRSFLGFTNYYRKFIYKYAQVAKPINALIAGENAKFKKRKVHWTEECQEAFDKLKEICSSTPILAYADYTKPFKLHTDASEKGLGAVLYQTQEDGSDRVIAFASRSLSKTERNYDAHRLEFLALKWAVTERFHEYLYGGVFEVFTDNNPLTYVLTTAKLDAAGQRWVAALANYNFSIKYRSGKANVDADSLSRIPWQMEEIQQFVLPVIQMNLMVGETRSDMTFDIPPIEPIELQALNVSYEFKLSRKDWSFEQGADDVIGEVLKLLVSGRSYQIKKEDNRDFKILWKMRKQLVLEDGLLYRKFYSTRLGENIFQFVMPSKFRKKALSICHDDYGHLGVDRVTFLLQERYFWPKMVQDVKAYIRNCDRCIRFKQPEEKAKLHPIEATYPFELIHMDFVKIGGGDSGRNVLVITDHFTRFATGFVTRSVSAKTVARLFVNRYCPFYTWPAKILTDRGGCFESKLFKRILLLTKIKKLRTTSYRPSTNGQCERFNLTLLRMIGTMPEDCKHRWVDWVPTLIHAYNCTVSNVTGYSPFYLVFGRLPQLPIDIEFDVAVENKAVSYSKFVKSLEKRLRTAHETAQKMIDKENTKQKKFYDKTYKCAELKINDLVLIRVKAFSVDHKIADRWERPVYRVVSQIKDKPAYVVQNTETQKCKTVHRNYIFPLRLRKDDEDLAHIKTTNQVVVAQAEFDDLFGCDCRNCVETV